MTGPGGVPHQDTRRKPAETLRSIASSDGDMLWEDMAAKDDAVFERLAKLRKAEAEPLTNLPPHVSMVIAAMPVVQDEEQKHRPKLKAGSFNAPYIALVARSVGKKEMMAEAKAIEAMQKEWSTMHERVWGLNRVREGRHHP